MKKSLFFVVALMAAIPAYSTEAAAKPATEAAAKPATAAAEKTAATAEKTGKFASVKSAAAATKAKIVATGAKVGSYVPGVLKTKYALAGIVGTGVGSFGYYYRDAISAQANKFAVAVGLKNAPVVEDTSFTGKLNKLAAKASIGGVDGKYVLAGTAAVVAALVVAARYAGLFGAQSLEDQVDSLIVRAQQDPNVLRTELPAILAQCDNDATRDAVLNYVFANVELTEDLKAEFGL